MRAVVAAESPLTDEVRGLVAALNAHLQPLSPPEFQFQLTAEQMAGEGVTVFVARDAVGRAVAMGSLKAHDDALGEVKRMFVDPMLRGTGLGRLCLEAVEAKARELGLRRLVLETGNTPGFEPAWRIYERAGFTRRGAFLDYPDSPYSRFYEKKLQP
ncbi:GNAT family N-acetyltransferase [Aurantimonas sp. MSK8Z-1]|uniref:GNAT family N-acetyltransferase n=1 Tax=Mangrovibrevibacter kandeliae TaxID=2968473 RepID=UPI002117CF22|nr:GNAT family N-acetyltransferase [Aurantimonas sp. MSK8Z-1]MCW4114673.1 GNAT family N-acetyltransferase [Aurantimonas sp. MSK8Z-1]